MRNAKLAAGAGAAAVIVAAGAAVAFGQLAGDMPDAPTPLGSDTSQVASLLVGPGKPTSTALARAASGALPEIDMTSARPVMSDGANVVYLARSAKDSARVCLLAAREEAEGVWAAGPCDELADIGSGHVVVQLQDRQGGLEVPRAYYGLVPRGVSSVSASWGGSAQVSDGVYAIRRASAESGSGALSFDVDDQRVEIPLG
jgi:hypothetical protein